MAKVLVLYYSSYGHIEQMAEAMASGARDAGATVDIKRVPETVPEEIAKGAHFKLDQAAPTLPFSAPRAHRPPAWSRKAAICDDIRPKRVPVPMMIAS